VGVVLAFWFQFWTMTVDWPVNVGGRPWNSWPAFVPVGFEVMVLFAGFGVVFAFLGVSRLFPGKKPIMPVAEVTSNRFAIVLEEQATFDANAVRKLFEGFQAVHTEEREEDAPPARRISLQTVNWVLGAALMGTLVLHWLLGSDPARPNHEFLPEMVRAVPYESFSEHPLLPDNSAMQPPQPGTIARGQLPVHYRPTSEDATRAGKELANPLIGQEKRWLPRGGHVYANHCQVCHGPAGQGDGPVATAARLGKWSLVDDKVAKMPDGQLFHVLTYGKDKMASYAGQLSREDRWAAILHVRSLRKQGNQP
jgi:hypothetical protein